MGCRQTCEECCKKPARDTQGSLLGLTLILSSLTTVEADEKDERILMEFSVHSPSGAGGRGHIHLSCFTSAMPFSLKRKSLPHVIYPTISQTVERTQYGRGSTMPKGTPSIPYCHNFLILVLFILIYLLLW